ADVRCVDRAVDQLRANYRADRVGVDTAVADGSLICESNRRAWIQRHHGGFSGYGVGVCVGISGHATGNAYRLRSGEWRFTQQLRYGQPRALGSRAVPDRRSLTVCIQGGMSMRILLLLSCVVWISACSS